MTLGDGAPVALLVARALHFCATALLWGGGGLICLLPPRASQRCALRVTTGLAGLSGLAWLCATLVLITDDPASLFDPVAWAAFWASGFGPPWAIHLTLLFSAAILACFAERQATTALLALIGGVLAIDQAWLGHAAAGLGSAGTIALAIQATHNLAAYAWTGALPVLGLMLRRGDERAERALALFSTIGVLVVAAIVATGILNSSIRIEHPAQLLTSPYGYIVSLKAALVLAMIVLAWINRSFAASPRRVAAETLLGVVVLGVAAILGVTPPPG